jgi:hypothetical protein
MNDQRNRRYSAALAPMTPVVAVRDGEQQCLRNINVIGALATVTMKLVIKVNELFDNSALIKS